MESKNSQHFIDSSGREFHPLSFFADQDFYSLDYLKSAIFDGKLKAFRLGEDWLTTTEWVDDFKRKIKRQVEQEITLTSSTKTWVSYLPLRHSSDGVFDFAVSALMTIFISIWLGFLALAWHLSYPGSLPLADSQLTHDCWKLVASVSEVNNHLWLAPFKIVPKAPLFSDEEITQSWHEFVKQQEPALPSAGHVAGAKDKTPGWWR